MKFQDSSFNGLKVTVGTRSVTHPCTHAPTHPPTHAPKAICPIKITQIKLYQKKNDKFAGSARRCWMELLHKAQVLQQEFQDQYVGIFIALQN